MPESTETRVRAILLGYFPMFKRYEEPDREFTEMNSDCIKSAKELPL